MRKRLHAAALLALALVGAALYTPLGPWALLRGAALLSSPQTLQADGISGSLWSGFSLRGARFYDAAQRVELRVEELAISLRPASVRLQEPHLTLALAAATDSAQRAPVAIQLPIEWLPDLHLINGSADVDLGDGSHLRLQGWSGRYRSALEQTGSLDMQLHTWQIDSDSLQITGSLAARAMLHTDYIDIDSLQADVHVDALRALIGMAGRLDFSAQRALRTTWHLHATGHGDSLRAEADVAGALQPLALRAALRGHLFSALLGEVPFAADARVDTAHATLDSLQATVLAGVLHAQARYALSGDSLSATLRAEQLALAHIDSTLSGSAAGHARAEFDFATRRYSAETRFFFNDIHWPGARPFDAALQGQHLPDGTTHLQLDSPAAALVAHGQSDLEGQYELHISGQLQPRAAFDLDMAPINLRATLRPDTLQLFADTAHLPAVADTPFGPVRAEVNLRAARYVDARIELEDSLLVGRGLFDLRRGRTDSFHIAVHRLPLSRLAQSTAGALSLDLRADGPLAIDSLLVQVDLQAGDVRHDSWRGGDIAAGLRWSAGTGSGWARTAHAQATVSIDSAQNVAARAAFRGLQLHSTDGDSLALVGELTLRTPLYYASAGSAELAIDSLDLAIGGAGLTARAPLHLRYADGLLASSQALLHTPLGPMTIAGSASVDALSVDVDWPQIDMSALATDLHLEQGTGHMTISGRLAQPQMDGWMDLRAVRLDTALLGDLRVDWTLRDSLVARATLRQRQRPALTASVSAPTLGTGRAEPGTAAHISLSIDALSLRAPLTYMLGSPARGLLSLSADVHVPLVNEHGALRGDVRVEQFSIDAQIGGEALNLMLAPGARAQANQQGIRLEGLLAEMSRYDRDAEAFLPAGTLSLDGRLPTDGDSDVRLHMADVDLLLLGGPDGMANLQAQLTGTYGAPQLFAHLDIATDDLGSAETALTGDSTGAYMHLRWNTLLQDSLTVKGHLPWNLSAGRIDWTAGWLEAHSDGIDLSALVDLLTDLDALGGRALGQVHARGLDSTLTLDGHIDFADVQLALLGVTPTYALPDGRLAWSGRRGTLRNFSSGPTNSYDEMAMSGFVDLGDLLEPTFDVALRARGLDLHYADIFRDDDINVDLRMAGSTRRSQLSGSLTLQSPVAEPVFVVLNSPPVPPPPPALRDEFLENMELDVHVQLRDLQVDSELTNARASGGIGISGTFYKPVFQGDVVLDEGSIYVLNRPFELEEGRIVLNSLVPTRSLLEVAYDPLVLDPTLDLRATAQVVDRGDGDARYTVTMSLQGAAQSAAPRFESTPALDFNRIVNLLAFGTTDVSDFNYGTALGTAAGRLLSKRVARVGIDEFAVLPSSNIIGVEQGQPALRMGKFLEIPFPMWVRYEAAINSMGQGEVRLEHRLNSILTLTGSAQSEYDRYGLGIGLKKEF